MKVELDTSRLGLSRWYEYAIRFMFGGTITALTGIVAQRYGPEIGGLFLAFPAILTAAASLIEKHEKEKRERAGLDGTVRGRVAAGIDAAGAAMGSFGLMTFALVVWQKLPSSSLSLVLAGATLAWLTASVMVWEMRETLYRSIRAKLLAVSNHGLHAAAPRGSSTHRRLDE